MRDAATVRLLGGGLAGDALFFAWTIPNAFRRLFGEGALSAAFMPEFARVLEQEGRDRARDVARVIISTLGALLVLLTATLVILLMLLPEQAVASVLDLPLEKVDLTRRYLALLLPYLAVICVIAQFMGVMHTLGEFVVPALAPVLLNVIWIVAAVVAGPLAGDDTVDRGFVIIAAILGASVVQFAWHLPRMKALGVGFRPVRPRVTPELRAVAVRLGPLLLAMGAAQVNVVADRSIAMAALPDGGVVHLYLGMRLMQFPLGLVSIALSTAVFPVLNRMFLREQVDAAVTTTRGALRMNLLLSLPAAVGLLHIAGPLVGLLFEGGEFGRTGVELSARALQGYALGIPFLGVIMVLNRVCFAMGNARLPMRVAGLAVVVNIGLDLALVGPFGEAGLAAATTLTAGVHAVILHVLLRGRLRIGPARPLLGSLKGLLAATLVMFVVLSAVRLLLIPTFMEGELGLFLDASRVERLMVIAVEVAAGALAFALAARALCRDDWRLLLTCRRRDDAGPAR